MASGTGAVGGSSIPQTVGSGGDRSTTATSPFRGAPHRGDRNRAGRHVLGRRSRTRPKRQAPPHRNQHGPARGHPTLAAVRDRISGAFPVAPRWSCSTALTLDRRGHAPARSSISRIARPIAGGAAGSRSPVRRTCNASFSWITCQPAAGHGFERRMELVGMNGHRPEPQDVLDTAFDCFDHAETGVRTRSRPRRIGRRR